MTEMQQLLEITQRISKNEEALRSVHKRIDDNDSITNGIHKLASNVESLALQVKMLTESVDASIARLEESLKRQGERIGALEAKPAARWESLVGQIIGLAAAGSLGGVLGKFM